MDKKEQVTQWVKNKIGKVLDEDLRLKIVDESSCFDVKSYVDYLEEEYFNDNDVENLKKGLNTVTNYDLYLFESENSSEEQNSIQNSFGLESSDYQSFPVEEIIKNLENNSEEVRIKFLNVLEISVEDLISLNFLNKIVEILNRNLSKTENSEIHGLVLKIFQKVIKFPKNPQIICKGFTTIAELLTSQIDIFNLRVNNTFDKIYDIKEEKWIYGIKSSDLDRKKLKSSVDPEILIKLMKLLLDCQQQIRSKGVRFNETRFREVIFSFVHLLSSTTATSEDTKISGLEIVSVLDPKANWCRNWCHTAVGRTLLCSALRKYKNFFIHIIEVMLKHMKSRKQNRLPSVTKSVSKEYNVLSSKNEKQNRTKQKSSEWVVKDVPRVVVNEAVFFHSISLVSCLIQFRSGRALFPVQTPTKKRLLNVQDLSLSIIEHFEHYTRGDGEIGYTSAYQDKVLEILNDLKKLKSHINSSRVSTDRQISHC